MYRNLIQVLAVGLLCACGGTPPLGGAPKTSVVEGSLLPVPSSSGSVNGSYAIGPFDVLTIGVYGIAELEPRDVQVNGQGTVSFPMVGSVQAAGRTPAELEAAIAAGLRAAFVRDPQVTVNLREMNSHNVTVDGQVRQPGLYPAFRGLTLMSAVAQAQGVTDLAKMDDVVVFRSVEGQRYAALYNLSAIRRGAYGDPQLFAGDIVVVGESRARQLFRDLLQIAPAFTSPLVIALQG